MLPNIGMPQAPKISFENESKIEDGKEICDGDQNGNTREQPAVAVAGDHRVEKGAHVVPPIDPTRKNRHRQILSILQGTVKCESERRLELVPGRWELR